MRKGGKEREKETKNEQTKERRKEEDEGRPSDRIFLETLQ
jgi:hypothetical protein